MKMILSIALVLASACSALAQSADWTYPPLRSPEATVRADMNAELANIQSLLAAKLDDAQAGAIGLTVLGAANAAAVRTAIGLGTAALAATGDFAAASHIHAIADVTGLQAALNGKASAAQGALADTAVQPGSLATVATTGLYSSLTGIPGTFPPSTHGHPIADISGLQAALDAKAALSHTHTATQISDSTSFGRTLLTAASVAAQRTALGLGTAALAATGDFAAAIHTHAIADVTGLSAALAGLQALDADLTTIAGLTPTTDNIMQAKAGAWASRTIAQVKTDLGLTGTNSGDQTITLTGQVTGSGTGSFGATITAGTVTLAQQANIATARIIGRVTAGSGAQEELTGTQATTLLDQFTSALKGLAPPSGGGTVNFLRADGSWALPVATQIIDYSADATWTKPAGAQYVEFILIGAGSGGASGRMRADTTTAAAGGGGGGAGGRLHMKVPAALLGATVAVVVGLGGTGGASRATTQDGANGLAGGNTSFGSFVARGGTASVGAGTSSSTGGVAGGAAGEFVSAGTAYLASGANGALNANGNPGNSGGLRPGGGGGSAGHAAASNTGRSGGDGGDGGASLGASASATGGGGAAGATQANGSNGAAAPDIFVGGDGGGGGGNGVAGAAGAGGNGGYPGGGGGGGGASTSGAGASGKGGDGANGSVRVIVHF